MIDPSGYCGVASSPIDPAFACWQVLRQIEQDFPFIDLASSVNYDFPTHWTLDEIIVIRQGLDKLRSKTSANLLSVFGQKGVIVQRWRATYRIGAGFVCGDTFPLPPYRINIYNSTFEIPDCMESVIGHEIAHVWDNKKDISKHFVTYVGAWEPTGSICGIDTTYNPGLETPPVLNPPDRCEDYAWSFQEYVYNRPNPGIVRGQSRWIFIRTLLSTGTVPVLPPWPPC